MIGRNVFRVLFFLPNVISGLLLGYIWQYIFKWFFPQIGALTGFSFLQMPWLGNNLTCLLGITIVMVWQMSGFLMIIYIAGIISIPVELSDCARIDGAAGWRLFRYITIPMIMPSITVCLFLSILDSIRFRCNVLSDQW